MRGGSFIFYSIASVVLGTRIKSVPHTAHKVSGAEQTTLAKLSLPASWNAFFFLSSISLFGCFSTANWYWIYCRLQPNVLRRDWRELPTPRGLAQTQSDAVPLLFDIHHSHTPGPVTTPPGNSAHFSTSFFISEAIHHTIQVISIQFIRPPNSAWNAIFPFQKNRHFCSNWRPSWIFFIGQSEMSNFIWRESSLRNAAINAAIYTPPQKIENSLKRKFASVDLPYPPSQLGCSEMKRQSSSSGRQSWDLKFPLCVRGVLNISSVSLHAV